MVLIGVVPECFAYGFIAMVFTHNPWVGPAMIHFLFYGITAWAVHRCDVENMPRIQPRCETLLRDMLPYQVIPAWIGVFLGAAFVWAFDMPRLLNFQLFFDHPYRSSKLFGLTSTDRNKTTGGGDVGTPHNVKPYFWTWLIVMAGMAAGIAIYFYELRFSENCVGDAEMTDGQQYAVAISLTVVAVLFVLIYTMAICMAETDKDYADASIRRLPDGHRHSAVLNIKYMFFFGLVFALPAIYDLLSTSIPSPWTRWGLQVSALALLLVIIFVSGANLSNDYSGDRYLGTLGVWSLAFKLFVFWVLYTTVYLSAPLADSGFGFGPAGPEVRDSVIWVGIFGGSFFVVLLFVGYVYRSGHDQQLEERDATVAAYRAQHLDDDRKTMRLTEGEPLVSRAAASVVESDRGLRRRAPNATVNLDDAKRTSVQLDF